MLSYSTVSNAGSLMPFVFAYAAKQVKVGCVSEGSSADAASAINVAIIKKVLE